jgi:abequosyltransferase
MHEDDPTDRKRIRLSICIPTINRGSVIGATLNSILSQADDEVEVVVVDDGSDNTGQVVSELQTKFSCLRYFRDEEKTPSVPSAQGFDRGVCRAVELATGEYCWLFTDDDVLRPGAIHEVLDAIRGGYGLVVVNAEVRSSDFSKTLEPRRLQIARDRVYEPADGERLFTEVADYLTFLGAVVVKRELWNSRQKDPYVGSGFIHVGVVFQSPIRERALVIAEPLITIRYGDALYMRTPRYFQIWMVDWPNLVWSFDQFTDSAKGRVCRKEPWRRKRTLLLFRATGAFSKREYCQWLEERLSSKWDACVTKLIAGFPGRGANLLGIIYYYASGRRSGQFLLDLVKSPFYFARPFHDPEAVQE